MTTDGFVGGPPLDQQEVEVALGLWVARLRMVKPK